MNLTLDEKRIRQLFGEMSLEDARRAPDFERLVQAGSRGARPKSGVRALALAGSFAVLVVAVLTAAVLIARHPNSQAPSDADRSITGSFAPPEIAEPVIPHRPKSVGSLRLPVSHAARAARRIRSQRRSNELAIAMKSLSVWQSPTASLLNAPGEELLKSLPRLGDSLQTLRSFSVDEND
jgi:hypothetical protein